MAAGGCNQKGRLVARPDHDSYRCCLGLGHCLRPHVGALALDRAGEVPGRACDQGGKNFSIAHSGPADHHVL